MADSERKVGLFTEETSGIGLAIAESAQADGEAVRETASLGQS
jgi:hypothetical protein